jgi:hypothetical protein
MPPTEAPPLTIGRDESVYGPTNIEERRAHVQPYSELPPQYPGDKIEAPMGYLTPASATDVKHLDYGDVPVSDTGEDLPWIKRPGVLPIYRDPDAGIRFAMPAFFDLASNITGAPVGATAINLARNVLSGERGASVLSAMGAKPAIDLDLTRGIGWDQNRIDKEINYSHYDDGRSKAMVAFVNPNDFLAATTPSAKAANDIAKEADVLDLNKLSKESQSPFLKVQDGKITNHEGRHRMAAMASAGYDRVPVILDYGKGTALSSSDVLSFKGQHPKSPSIKVQNAIPLNKQYADQISKIMQEKNTHFQRGGSIVDRALNLTRGHQR